MEETKQIEVFWMSKDLIPEVLEISMDVFDGSWTKADFSDVLKAGGFGLVLRFPENPEILGYVMYDLIDNKLQILNFAIKKEFQDCGLGKLLIKEMKEKSKAQNKELVDVEIPESNLNAQLFLKSQGFKFVRTLKDYFESVTHIEDGYVFQYANKKIESKYPPISYENRIARFLK